MRNTRTDFPVLTCAASLDEGGARLVFGARPQIALVKKLEEETQKLTDKYVKLIDDTCADKNKEIMEV